MDELLELLKNTAPSYTIDTLEYKITVSVNADKVRIVERRTGKVKLIKDLNELEISLLAIVSAFFDRFGGAYVDKES